MIDVRLQELLICPQCHGELDFENQHSSQQEGDGVGGKETGNVREIHCQVCGQKYPVEGQIPLMFAGFTNDGFGHDLYRAQLRGNIFERVFHNNRIKTLLRLVTDELQVASDTRVLDVGCNTGPMLIPLRQRGYDVVGIDISTDDVHQAEQYLREHHLCTGGLSVADGTRLPFRDHSFDLALLVDILEHTDRPQHIVSEARRLLVPGGLVIATVPWASHPYVRYTWLRKLLSSRKTIDEHPDAPFRLEMLQSLFPSSDFEPMCFRLVFHWVCILGVYRVPARATETAVAEPGSRTSSVRTGTRESIST
jgi:SAM-dependent methyltransferase